MLRMSDPYADGNGSQNGLNFDPYADGKCKILMEAQSILGP
jgi:hypothetical protein